MANAVDVHIAQLETEAVELRKHLKKLIKDNIQLRWDVKKLEMHNSALLVAFCAVQQLSLQQKNQSIKDETESVLSFLKTKDEVSLAG